MNIRVSRTSTFRPPSPSQFGLPTLTVERGIGPLIPLSKKKVIVKKMNTRSRRRVTISKSNHPFIQDLLGIENVISKRQVFHHFPQQSSVHAGKFAEVHFTKKPNILQKVKVVSPLSSLRTPRKEEDRTAFTTPNQKPSRKSRGSLQVRTPNALHFLARSPRCALKIQKIAAPGDIHDKAYHEVLIHKSLAQTAGGCPGFTMLHQWFKSYNPSKNFQKPLRPRKESPSQHFQRRLFEADEDEDDDQEDENREYFMNFVLERADITLDSYLRNRKVVDQYTFKVILFQLLFSLQIMQRECGFVHHDLHKKNILIKNLEKGTILKFRLTDGDEWYVNRSLVKITDFGHSRIEMSSGHVVYNRARPCTAVFDASKDIMMIRSNFRGCKIQWEDDEQRNLKRSLFRELGKVRVTEDIRKLLKHPFFNSIKRVPSTTVQQGSNVICFEENSRWNKRRRKKKKKAPSQKHNDIMRVLMMTDPTTTTTSQPQRQNEEVNANVKNTKQVTGKKRKLYDGNADFESERSVRKKRKLDHLEMKKHPSVRRIQESAVPPPPTKVVVNQKKYEDFMKRYRNFGKY